MMIFCGWLPERGDKVVEHINIISQEPITEPLQWPITLVGALAIVAIFTVLIWATATKRMGEDRTGVLLGLVGTVGMSLLLIAMFICSVFFQVPTGRYRYEATIDKDKITVSEYGQFIEEYSPTIKDGIYYWEDKAE
jgi:hypothetical protein